MLARSIKNPIATTTTYRFNVKLDKRTILSNQQNNHAEENCIGNQKDQQFKDELYDVCEHELLFRNKAHKHHHRIECFSALNGTLNDSIPNMEFVGIAVTGCAVCSPMTPQGFTAARAGLHTIMNTGNEVIEAGEKVYWKIPEASEYANYANSVRLQGVPHLKRCAMTVKGEPQQGDHCGTLGMALSKAQPGQPMDILLN